MSQVPIHIVTGATQGIGRAVAIVLAARGLRVVAVGRSQERLNSLKSQVGQQLTVICADLATAAGIEQIRACVALESDIAGIVHSAGSLVSLEPYQRLDTDALVEHFRIHVGAPIALFQALSQSHQIQRMLFVDSYSASTGRHGWSAYSIVKAAAQMAAKCAAQELHTTNIVRVFPGAVRTQVVDKVLASDTPTATAFAGMLARGEIAQPDDVAQFMVALLVDAPDELLSSREAFDYNNPLDRADVL